MEDEKQKSLEYLKNDLKYLGFGDSLNVPLEEMLKKLPEKFQLRWNGEFKNPDGSMAKVDYAIDFKQGNNPDKYFLNTYTATLKNEADPAQDKSQTFYINRGHGVTAKEAFNLLEGRAVYKKDQVNRENQKYNGWIQLDFQNKEANGNFKHKTYHDKYGFDLEHTLAMHPIKLFDDKTVKTDLIQSLEKGNITPALFLNEGSSERVFMVANPQFKTVNVYDANMKTKSQSVTETKKEQGSDHKNDQKQSVKPESDEDHSEKSEKTKRKGVKM